MDGNPSNVRFVQAKFYHKGRRGVNGDGRIHGAVIHDMESGEGVGTAESTANYFATGVTRPSSAEYCIDSNSIVQCVRDGDEAYHAPPASRHTLGLEHAGMARQTPAQWRDPYSWAMLRRSAEFLAFKAGQYGFYIPDHFQTPAELLKVGYCNSVTTHNNVSVAWKESQHWDPGSGYPEHDYLAMARTGTHTVPPPPPDRTLRQGDSGPAVAFLQAMTNILILAGYVKHDGLAITTPAGFGPKTKSAVIAVQKFGNAMAKMAGNKYRVAEDGVADADTCAIYAFWMPSAQKKINSYKWGPSR